MSRKLIIAGGGIGGMTAALALHRAGHEVTIFERTPAFTEIGAGMSLWPNATRILQALGVMGDVLAHGEPVSQFNLQRPDGRTISTIPMDGFSTPAVCIHRADLHQALRQALTPVRLVGNQTVQSFGQDASGVFVQFASGLEARADGLIGADGINSAVRAQIHGNARPIYRGYRIWRGIAPDRAGRVRGHISETWGAGQRFGILPIGQGRICWYATRNGPPAHPDSPEGRKAEIEELFHDWHSPIPELIAATPQESILKNDARDRRPLRHWGEHRVTLLGDAAHPITPNVGQGACMAIEDAACLAKALAAAGDVPSAFRAYESMRRSRTAFVARQSRRIGAIGQWENPWVVKGRNFVTRLVLSCAPDAPLNAVYGYKI